MHTWKSFYGGTGWGTMPRCLGHGITGCYERDIIHRTNRPLLEDINSCWAIYRVYLTLLISLFIDFEHNLASLYYYRIDRFTLYCVYKMKVAVWPWNGKKWTFFREIHVSMNKILPSLKFASFRKTTFANIDYTPKTNLRHVHGSEAFLWCMCSRKYFVDTWSINATGTIYSWSGSAKCPFLIRFPSKHCRVCRWHKEMRLGSLESRKIRWLSLLTLRSYVIAMDVYAWRRVISYWRGGFSGVI